MPRTPKAQNLEAHINQIIAQAASQIVAVLRNGLGGGARKSSAAHSAPAAERQSGGATRPRRRRGRKSGPNVVTLDKVVAIIRATPNLRSEQIQKQLGLPQAQVKAALAKLRSTGRVKTAGARRATTYSAT